MRIDLKLVVSTSVKVVIIYLMPKNVMDGKYQRDVFVLLAERNPELQNRMEGMDPLEYYELLDIYDQNAVSLLVHAAAFLQMEASPGLESQLVNMKNDARRKGSSGEKLLEISQQTAKALEEMREQGIIGRWFYVPQAGGEITYGLDAAGVDWIVEDLQAGGFKALQSGTNPRNIEDKQRKLSEYYGKNMQTDDRILGLFGTVNGSGNLFDTKELASNIGAALSNTGIIAKTR